MSLGHQCPGEGRGLWGRGSVRRNVAWKGEYRGHGQRAGRAEWTLHTAHSLGKGVAQSCVSL